MSTKNAVLSLFNRLVRSENQKKKKKKNRKLIYFFQDDFDEFIALTKESQTSLPIAIRHGVAPPQLHFSRQTPTSTIPLPGASFELQFASNSLPWIDSEESFVAICAELDAVLLRAPLTLFALELNGVLRFESQAHQLVTEALVERISSAGLVSCSAMRVELLPPTSRVVVESFTGGRSQSFVAATTIIVHQSAIVDRAQSFAIEFFSNGAPACGLLCDDAHRAALHSVLSEFRGHGVLFEMAAPVVDEEPARLLAAYRSDNGAKITGFVPGCAVEIVVDLYASDSMLPGSLYGGASFGGVVRRALVTGFDALARRQPLLLASTQRTMERKAVELASITLALQAVQSQSRSPLLAAQPSQLGATDAAHLLRPLCARFYDEARDDSVERLLALTLARTAPHQLDDDSAEAAAVSRHSSTASTNANTTLSMYETDDIDSMWAT
jgi:hypothetical protein